VAERVGFKAMILYFIPLGEKAVVMAVYGHAALL
jgi:hypothetical protein